MQNISFRNRHRDHSNDAGFRFEFFCGRCNDGYMTQFKPYTVATVNNILNMGESLFGGFFHQVSSVTERMQSSGWEVAKDKAYMEAVEEARRHFFRCSKCGDHFCKNCWNPQIGLCAGCAPFIAQEIQSAKQYAAVEQIQEHARQMSHVTPQMMSAPMQVTCPVCQSPAGSGLFCPNCGAQLLQKKVCSRCGTQADSSANFCPGCGGKV
jgi:membrane protease subunit (stomatin/prohibitin family)